MSAFPWRKAPAEAPHDGPTMRAVRIAEASGNIEWRDVARPTLPDADGVDARLASRTLRAKLAGSGMVLVRVEMAGIAQGDYLARRRRRISSVAAAAATWIFRGDESRRRRGCRVDSPGGRQPRRGYFAETSRGDAAGAAWIVRGDGSRDVDIPWRRVAATPRVPRG